MLPNIEKHNYYKTISLHDWEEFQKEPLMSQLLKELPARKNFMFYFVTTRFLSVKGTVTRKSAHHEVTQPHHIFHIKHQIFISSDSPHKSPVVSTSTRRRGDMSALLVKFIWSTCIAFYIIIHLYLCFAIFLLSHTICFFLL